MWSRSSTAMGVLSHHCGPWHLHAQCERCGEFAAGVVVKNHMAADHVDVALDPLIGGAHAGCGGIVGPGPLPHRPFQRPVPRAHQRRHHFREAFTRRKLGKLAEMAAIIVPQLAPRLDQRGAIPRDVGEMPVEAALGDRQATAQPVDLQCFDALFRQDREAGLDPVVDRQPGVRRGARTPHERQPTTRGTTETNADVMLYLSQVNDRERQSGVLAYWSHVLLHTHNWKFSRSALPPHRAQSSGRDSAVKQVLRCRMAVCSRRGKLCYGVTGRWMELLYEVR